MSVLNRARAMDGGLPDSLGRSHHVGLAGTGSDLRTERSRGLEPDGLTEDVVLFSPEASTGAERPDAIGGAAHSVHDSNDVQTRELTEMLDVVEGECRDLRRHCGQLERLRATCSWCCERRTPVEDLPPLGPPAFVQQLHGEVRRLQVELKRMQKDRDSAVRRAESAEATAMSLQAQLEWHREINAMCKCGQSLAPLPESGGAWIPQVASSVMKSTVGGMMGEKWMNTRRSANLVSSNTPRRPSRLQGKAASPTEDKPHAATFASPQATSSYRCGVDDTDIKQRPRSAALSTRAPSRASDYAPDTDSGIEAQPVSTASFAAMNIGSPGFTAPSQGRPSFKMCEEAPKHSVDIVRDTRARLTEDREQREHRLSGIMSARSGEAMDPTSKAGLAGGRSLMVEQARRALGAAHAGRDCRDNPPSGETLLPRSSFAEGRRAGGSGW